jgi:hypothetical protein
MSDAMQIARQRIKDHEDSIARKEREIEDLREMIGDLERFLEFGQELIGGSAQATARPVSHQPQPVRPTTQQPQIKEVLAQAAKKADEEDDDDEWGSDTEKNIEAVLAARKA